MASFKVSEDQFRVIRYTSNGCEKQTYVAV